MNRRPPQPRDRSTVTRRIRPKNRRKPDFLALFRNLLMLVLIAQSLRVAFASPKLRLKEVSLQGTQRLTAADVVKLGHVPVGQNVFRVNLVKVAESLEKDPIVRRAIVTRDLPNRLNVEIKERKPVYQVSCAGARYDIDDEGVLFRQNKAYIQGKPILEVPENLLPKPGEKLRGDIAKAYDESGKLAKKNTLDLRHLRVDQGGELWLNIATSPVKSQPDGDSQQVAGAQTDGQNGGQTTAQTGGRLKVRVGRFTDLPQKFRDIHQALQGWPDLTATAAHLDVMCPGRPAYMSAANLPDQKRTRSQ